MAKSVKKNETLPVKTVDGKEKKTKKRSPQSELHQEFDGILTMVGKEKIANAVSQELGVTTEEAHSRIRATVARVGKSNGIVAKRSETMVTLIFQKASELKPALIEFIDSLQNKIQYRNTKTGKRGGSWITSLLAGVPRLQADGSFKAFVTIDKEQAQEICDSMEIALPVEVDDKAVV